MQIARQIILHLVESEKTKDLVIEVLKNLARHTDNQVDDELVTKLEEAMYSNKNKLN